MYFFSIGAMTALLVLRHTMHAFLIRAAVLKDIDLMPKTPHKTSRLRLFCS